MANQYPKCPNGCSGILKFGTHPSKFTGGSLWSSYDAQADTLYVNFKKPACATDSELTPDDIIIRYEGNEIIGLTILHASKR